jgi:hypothetical protein
MKRLTLTLTFALAFAAAAGAANSTAVIRAKDPRYATPGPDEAQKFSP